MVAGLAGVCLVQPAHEFPRPVHRRPPGAPAPGRTHAVPARQLVDGSEGREALAAHAENFAGTVELDGDAASIANFCLDGIGFVMTHAGEPEIYFMINR